MPNVLVTGANRGIGLALVEAAAARGDHVVATARDPEAPALAALAARHPGRVETVAMDVTSLASCRAAAALSDRPIDLLVANAGVYGPDRQSTLDMDFDGFLSTLDVNTLGPLRTVQAFLPRLRAAGGARVLTVTSRMGQMRSASGDIAYRTSKTAVNKLMRALAADLSREGIAVAVAHPGWVRTDMGGANADISVEESAAGLLAVADRLGPETTGRFFDWRGGELDW